MPSRPGRYPCPRALSWSMVVMSSEYSIGNFAPAPLSPFHLVSSATVSRIDHTPVSGYISSPRGIFSLIEDDDALVAVHSLCERDQHQPVTATKMVLVFRSLPGIQLPVP